MKIKIMLRKFKVIIIKIKRSKRKVIVSFKKKLRRDEGDGPKICGPNKKKWRRKNSKSKRAKGGGALENGMGLR